MLFTNDDDVNNDTNNKNDAKAENYRLKKKKDHVSTLASIESSDSWCDVSSHY
jgi:hypothetical protein